MGIAGRKVISYFQVCLRPVARYFHFFYLQNFIIFDHRPKKTMKSFRGRLGVPANNFCIKVVGLGVD
jgi:hypothetical protein